MTSAEELGDELYVLPPHAFTAARDERIAEAKRAGDRELAKYLGGLKRPSVSAWLANLVGLRLGDDLERLIALGETIRAAQGSVSATELRDLSNQRRRELDTVVGQAAALARELDAEPGRQYLAELEGTLAAAMADAGTAEAVRAGRTLKALSYSGFGLSSVAGGTAPARPSAAKAGPGVKVTRPPATATAGPDAPADRAEAGRLAAEQQEAERREAQARAEAARARLAEADAVLAAASTAEEEADQRVRELTARLVAVKESLDDATRDARAARQARITAEREQATAQRRADRSVQ